jgi:hypothetical protein
MMVITTNIVLLLNGTSGFIILFADQISDYAKNKRASFNHQTFGKGAVAERA